VLKFVFPSEFCVLTLTILGLYLLYLLVFVDYCFLDLEKAEWFAEGWKLEFVG